MVTIRDPYPAGPSSEKIISEFENYISHRLPSDYRDFILNYNGGHPEPDALTLGDDGEEDIVLCFFPLLELSRGTVEVTEREALRTWPLRCAWDDLQHDLSNLDQLELDDPLLPIGTDGSSNYFCVVLAGDQRGRILFFDHETAETVRVADGFTMFLESLRPRVRTDYA